MTPDENILVNENDQLEEIYMMHGLSKENKVPRFLVLVSGDDLEKSNIRNSEVKNSEYIDSSYQ